MHKLFHLLRRTSNQALAHIPNAETSRRNRNPWVATNRSGVSDQMRRRHLSQAQAGMNAEGTQTKELSLHGVMMQLKLEGMDVSLWVLQDGVVSMLLENGQRFNGKREDTALKSSAENFLRSAARYLKHACGPGKPELAQGHDLRFYLLTSRGSFYLGGLLHEVPCSLDPVAYLFEAGVEVIKSM